MQLLTLIVYKVSDSFKFEGESDLGIFLGYSSNSQAYWVYNLRAIPIMESINVVINDSGATRMVKSEDNGVFDD